MALKHLFSRREFVIKGALFGCAGCLLNACNSKAEPERRRGSANLGSISVINETRLFSLERVVVFKDNLGLSVVSAVCTHQSCLLNVTGSGFRCPCHGALFDKAGRVIEGPAKRDLTWYELQIVENEKGSQVLVVNFEKEVDSSWRLKLTTRASSLL